MDNLPDDMLFEIVKQADAQSIANLAQTDRRFRDIINNEYVWKTVIQRDFPTAMPYLPDMLRFLTYSEIYRALNLYDFRVDITGYEPYENRAIIVNDDIKVYKYYKSITNFTVTEFELFLIVKSSALEILKYELSLNFEGQMNDGILRMYNFLISALNNPGSNAADQLEMSADAIYEVLDILYDTYPNLLLSLDNRVLIESIILEIIKQRNSRLYDWLKSKMPYIIELARSDIQTEIDLLYGDLAFIDSK